MKRILLVILCMVSILLSGCARISEYQKSIYDDNSKIAAQGDSYSFVTRIGNTNDNQLSIQFGTFYGKQTIWKLQANDDCQINVEYQLNIENGNFKICLINPDKTVENIAENNGNTTKTLKLSKGTGYIVIVGNNARGSFVFDFIDISNVDITRVE